jgi:hypothetical protein
MMSHVYGQCVQIFGFFNSVLPSVDCQIAELVLYVKPLKLVCVAYDFACYNLNSPIYKAGCYGSAFILYSCINSHGPTELFEGLASYPVNRFDAFCYARCPFCFGNCMSVASGHVWHAACIACYITEAAMHSLSRHALTYEHSHYLGILGIILFLNREWSAGSFVIC